MANLFIYFHLKIYDQKPLIWLRLQNKQIKHDKGWTMENKHNTHAKIKWMDKWMNLFIVHFQHLHL